MACVLILLIHVSRPQEPVHASCSRLSELRLLVCMVVAWQAVLTPHF